MKTERLNAFTDGVLAIVITIMVLELPLPRGTGLASLRPLAPLLGAYVLSFINVGIFWNNHHHLMSLARRIDGRVLWANLFLLFWLSLVPFIIRWIGEVHISPDPVAAYGVALVMAALAYLLLEKAIRSADPYNHAFEEAFGAGAKEWVSLALYLAGIALSYLYTPAAILCYVAVAALWFVPDRRVEKRLERDQR